MGPGLALTALALAAAACSGHGSTIPRDRPSLRLVRCMAAASPPLASDRLVAMAPEGKNPWQKPPQGKIVLGGGFNVGKRGTVSRGAVTLGTPSVSSSTLAVDKVVAVVRAKVGELRICYASDPSNASPAKSITAYRIQIALDGRVINADSTSRSLSPNLDGCIKRVLRSLVFPAPTGGAVGSVVTVSYPILFDSTAIPAPRPTPSKDDIDPWTPFARATPVPGAIGAARVAEAAVRSRLDALEKCFTGPVPTGSLRAMLEIDVTGELGAVRIGGLGDATGEACVARALAGIHLVTPTPEAVEVACDLARGDAQPWRVAPSAGYGVIEADRAKLVHDTATLVAGTSAPDPLPAKTYIVIAKRDTPGAMLQLALTWANDAEVVLVTVRDGVEAPLFLGFGYTSGSRGDDSLESDALHPALRVGAKLVTGCLSHATNDAKLSDAVAVGALVQRLATKCRTLKCAPTLLVTVDNDAVARDLVEIAGAARRAGFERVLLGGDELACDPSPATRPRMSPRRPRRPPVDID